MRVDGAEVRWYIAQRDYQSGRRGWGKWFRATYQDALSKILRDPEWSRNARVTLQTWNAKTGAVVSADNVTDYRLADAGAVPDFVAWVRKAAGR